MDAIPYAHHYDLFLLYKCHLDYILKSHLGHHMHSQKHMARPSRLPGRAALGAAQPGACPFTLALPTRMRGPAGRPSTSGRQDRPGHRRSESGSVSRAE